MEHFSEVLKILEGALKANGSMAVNYAGLLADKLERDGERQQARLVREQLTRAPKALAYAQEASRGVELGTLPIDGESRLDTVDVSRPSQADSGLLMPRGVKARVDDFLQSIKHHEELMRVGAGMPARMLVYGPPGTGKTQLARHVAAHLQLPLLTTRCDTLVSSMLGQTSRNLRRVFEFVQQSPCVLFLDEFDALAGARGNDRDVGELQRVVIALLQNIDALPDSSILVASTNHEQLLDPAIWRRFAFRIAMPMPDTEMREALWAKFLGGFSPPSMDLKEAAELSSGATGALIEYVSLDAKRDAVLQQKEKITEEGLLRRLGLALAMSRGIQLPHIDDEIRFLRSWAPRRFSLRALASLYGTTVRQITAAMKGAQEDGDSQQRRPSRPRRSGSAAKH